MTIRFLLILTLPFVFLYSISVYAANEDEKIIPYVEFKQATVQDAVGMLAEISDLNIAATYDAGQYLVTFRMKDSSVKSVIDTLARVSGLWYRYMRTTDSYLIMTAEQYQSDIVVFRDDLVKTFELHHQNVEAAAKTIRNLYGERVVLTLEYKNDDFIGLPFEEVEDAITTNVTTGGNNSSGSNNSNNRNNRNSSNGRNNNRFGNNQYGNNQFGNNQFGANGGQQQVTKGEDGTVAGEQLATIGNFTKDQGQLTSGQLSSLRGRQQIKDQDVAKVTDAQTPIYITVNRIHNLLFVRTTDESALKEIEELIEVSDKPTPQVLFEMEIIEITLSDSYNQEFDIGFNSAGKIDNFNIQSTADDAANTPPSNVTIDNIGINLSEATSANYALQVAALLRGENVHSGEVGANGGVYNFLNNKINASVELLKRNGHARTLSKPVLLASNNRQAKIFIGDEQIIATGVDTTTSDTTLDNNGNAIVSSGTTQVETERRKIGNTLYLMPSINADRTITIDILQDKSQVIRNGTQLPYFDNSDNEVKTQAIDAVNQSNIKTVVVAQDGLTVALGGMVSSSTSLKTSKVPLLGDLPFLGAMFRREEEVNSSSQYIMLITPHIIMSPDESVDKSRKVAGFDYNKNATHKGDEVYPDYGFDKYIEMTQFAVDAINNNAVNLSTENYQSIKPDHGSASAVFPLHGISARAHAIWQRDNLYINVFKVRNHTPIAQTLSPAKIHGRWLSATIADEQLSEFSDKSDSTWLYLVSDKPYQQVLKQLKSGDD